MEAETKPADTIPLACVPGAIPAAERPAHFALIAELFGGAVQERAELPDGYAFRFAADAFARVARFVANERKCCPFLRFEIAVSGGDGPVWLRLNGPEGTHAFLDAELPH
jgi:hypothetical protein